MKKIVVIISLFGAILSTHATVEMEKEFEERFKSFIKSGDVSLEILDEIWLYEDTPTESFIQTQGSLEATISRGIKNFQIVDIYPLMKKGLKNPVTIEGDVYEINIEPYKMMEIRFAEKINGGSDGWSYVLGKSDGRLYMVGLKKQIQSE